MSDDATGQKVLQQGDWIIEDLTIESHEGKRFMVLDQFVDLVFHESMFENMTHGKIRLRDGISLIQYLPIIGEETLTFAYKSFGDYETVRKQFSIYRVGNVKTVNDKIVEYTLFFVSEQALLNENTSISRSWNTKPVTDIVRNVYDDYLTGSDGKALTEIREPTMNTQSIVVPNWTPFQTINWCCSIAKSSEHVGSLYMFYENTAGYNLRHIEGVIDEGKNDDRTLKFSQKLAGSDPNENENVDAVWPIAGSIASYRVIKTTDKLGSLTDGMMASRTISYDNVTKAIRVNDFDYRKSFANQSTMSDNSLVSDGYGYTSPLQRVIGKSTKTHRNSSGRYSSNQSLENGMGEDSPSLRSSMLSQLTANQIEIQMYGDSRLTVGMMINVELQNYTALKDKKKRKGDRFIDELMLIGDCKHMFNASGYTIMATLYKDSMSNSPIFDLTDQGSDGAATDDS